MLEGVDCSNNQGSIDWAAVAGSGRRFAFVKATEGDWFHDRWFARNWAALAEQEMWRGAYHFARPGQAGTGADEAHYFCDYVSQQPILQGDLYAIDLEQAPDQVPPGTDLGAYLLDWCQTVEDRLGVAPLIYSTPYMLESWQCTGNDALARYGLWLAAWGTRKPKPPPNWPVWAFWQYSDKGQVPGVQGPCDLDRFNGTEEQLGQYGQP